MPSPPAVLWLRGAVLAHTGLLQDQSLTALPQGPTTDRQDHHLGLELLEFGCKLPQLTWPGHPTSSTGVQGLGSHHCHHKLSMTQMEEPSARPSSAKQLSLKTAHLS